MAIFIPEWAKVSGKHMHMKQVLNSLDASYVIRRSLSVDSSPADFFIQHLTFGWLAIAAEDIDFKELDPAQLFVSPQRLQLEQRLEKLGQLSDRSSADTSRRLAVCVVMWSCSSAEVEVLSQAYATRYSVEWLSREAFMSLSAEQLKARLSWITVEAGHDLLCAYFPEAEIPVTCTARGLMRRDNKSKLNRIFLDFEQEWASKLDLDIPEAASQDAKDFSLRLINGVAGSGKTLIALHRALMLAEKYPDEQFLMLIFNTPIVADIKEKLHRTRGGIPANLEINTFFSWASAQWFRMFNTYPKMVSDPSVITDWIKYHRPKWPELDFTDKQLLDELDFINDSMIFSEVAYLKALRQGRKFSLKPKERAQVWALYEYVSKSLRSAQGMMWSALSKEICIFQSHHRLILKYKHVMIDEAQFFAPSWFRLVKLSLKQDGQLFLCADPNQGFMKNRLSWKSAGLDVAGRTKRLHRSYRTTRQILQAACGVIASLDHPDKTDYLAPDFKGMPEGPEPILMYTHSPQDAVDRLVNEVTKAHRGDHVPLPAMLIIFGEKIDRNLLYNQLCWEFSMNSLWWFNKEDQKKAPVDGYGKEYLRMTSVGSATGLEGGIVFLLGIEELFGDVRLLDLSEDEREELHEKNRRMLFMAMTRAGHQLVFIASQPLPAEMEKLFKVVM